MTTVTNQLQVIIDARNQAERDFVQLRNALLSAQQQGNLTADSFRLLTRQMDAASAQARRWDQMARAMQPVQTATQAATSAMSQLSATATTATASAGGMAGSLGGLAAAAGPAAAAIGTAVAALKAFEAVTTALQQAVAAVVSTVVQGNSELSNQAAAFRQLIGPAGDYRKVMADLTTLANQTPLGSDQVVKLGRDLLAAKTPADQLNAAIVALANQMAVMGPVTAQGTESVGRALKQIANVGRVQGDELMQLSDAGINAVDALAFAFGKSTAEITRDVESGRISSEMLIYALQKYGLEGPRNVGALANSMNTLSGAADQLSANFRTFIVEAGKPFYDMLERGVIALAKFAQSKEVAETLERIKAAIAVAASIIREQLIPTVQKFAVDIAGNGQFTTALRSAGEMIGKFALGAFIAIDATVRLSGILIGTWSKQFQVLGEVATMTATHVTKTFRTLGETFEAAKNLDFEKVGKLARQYGQDQAFYFETLGGKIGELVGNAAKGLTQDFPKAVEDAIKDGRDLFKGLTAPITIPVQPELNTGNKPDPVLDPAKVRAFAEAWNKSVEAEKEAIRDAARASEKVRADLARNIAEKQRVTTQRIQDELAREVEAQVETARRIGEIRANLREKLAELADGYLDKVNAVRAKETELAAETSRKYEEISAATAERIAEIQQTAAARIAEIERDAADKRGEIAKEAAERQKEYEAERAQALIELANRIGEMQAAFDEKFAEKRLAIRERTLERLRDLEESQAKARIDFEKDAVEKRLQTLEDLELERGRRQRRGEDTSDLDKEKKLRLADLADQEKVERQRMERKLARQKEEAEAEAALQQKRALDELAREQEKERNKLIAAMKAEQDKTLATLAELEKREQKAKEKDAERIKAIEDKKVADINAVIEAANKDVAEAQRRANKQIEELNRVRDEKMAKHAEDIARLTVEYEKTVQAETDKANKAIAELERVDAERHAKVQAQIARIQQEADLDIAEAKRAADERIAEIGRSTLEMQIKSNEARNKLIEDNQAIAASYGVVIARVDEWKRALEGLPGVTVNPAAVTGVPRMAAGGVVTKPTLAIVGEAGPEAVVPLNRLGRAAGGGGPSITVHVHGSLLTEGDVVAAVKDAFIDDRRRNITNGFDRADLLG